MNTTPPRRPNVFRLHAALAAALTLACAALAATTVHAGPRAAGPRPAPSAWADGIASHFGFQPLEVLRVDPKAGPFVVADMDGDGLNDGAEVSLGTNPLNKDSDNDAWSLRTPSGGWEPWHLADSSMTDHRTSLATTDLSTPLSI